MANRKCEFTLNDDEQKACTNDAYETVHLLVKFQDPLDKWICPQCKIKLSLHIDENGIIDDVV